MSPPTSPIPHKLTQPSAINLCVLCAKDYGEDKHDPVQLRCGCILESSCFALDKDRAVFCPLCGAEHGGEYLNLPEMSSAVSYTGTLDGHADMQTMGSTGPIDGVFPSFEGMYLETQACNLPLNSMSSPEIAQTLLQDPEVVAFGRKVQQVMDEADALRPQTTAQETDMDELVEGIVGAEELKQCVTNAEAEIEMGRQMSELVNNLDELFVEDGASKRSVKRVELTLDAMSLD